MGGHIQDTAARGENVTVLSTCAGMIDVHAIELALEEDQEKRQAAVDEFLADFSWDKTFAAISGLIEDAIAKREKVRVAVTV